MSGNREIPKGATGRSARAATSSTIPLAPRNNRTNSPGAALQRSGRENVAPLETKANSQPLSLTKEIPKTASADATTAKPAEEDIPENPDGSKISPNYVQPAFRPLPGTTLHWTNRLEYIKTVVLKSLLEHDSSWPFLHPVPAGQLGIPDYYRVIGKPMDLGTIQKRLDHFYYRNGQACINDFKVIFNNCRVYNVEPHSDGTVPDIIKMAHALEKLLAFKLTRLPAEEVEIEMPGQAAALDGALVSDAVKEHNSIPESEILQTEGAMKTAATEPAPRDVRFRRNAPTSSVIAEIQQPVVQNTPDEVVGIVKTLFMYTVLLVLMPVVSYFGAKKWIFEDVLGYDTSSSFICWAVLSVAMINVVLGIMVYRCHTDNAPPAPAASSAAKQD